jgi:hypothetical protein
MNRSLLALGLLVAAVAPARANDFPTVDRVEFVEACMRDRQGMRQEFLYKCSCAIDALAAEVKYAEYVELQTAARAISIAGERGAVVREAADAQAMAKRFRALEDKAKKQCFLD